VASGWFVRAGFIMIALHIEAVLSPFKSSQSPLFPLSLEHNPFVIPSNEVFSYFHLTSFLLVVMHYFLLIVGLTGF
jgi:hypothetical protein